MNVFEETTEQIAQHGYVMQIDHTDEGVPFIYTIGLQGRPAHPDLIMFGLPEGQLYLIVSQLAGDIKTGRKLSNEERVVDVTQCPLCIRRVDARLAAPFVPRAISYYGKAAQPLTPSLDLMQIVLPDKSGKFPWEPEFKQGPHQAALWGMVH